jgi:hypothetical protein
VDLTPVAAAVVRGEPGAFETFVNEAQGRSSDEMSAAALERTFLLPTQDEDVRAGLPHRERLLAAVPADSWLYGLLMVVDLEPLLVLHRPSGTGFEVVIVARVLPADEAASWLAKVSS